MKSKPFFPALSACLMFAAASISVANEIPKVLPIGSPMPSFELPGIDGRTHRAADYAEAQLLCIVFTSNHCPDSVSAATRLEAIHQDYKDKGVALVAVNGNNPDSLRPDELGYSPYNDSFEEMKPFASDYGWTFPYLYDGETQQFTSACGAQSTPHVFVFDAERKLRYTGRMDDARRQRGPVESSLLRDALDALLAGREPAEAVTRSFGCSTKWLFKRADVEAAEKAWRERPVTLADLDTETAAKLRKNEPGIPRIINFWTTTCGPCVAEFPDLVDTYRRFQNRGVELITISLDPADKQKDVRKFLESQHAAAATRTLASLREQGRESNNYLWTGENPDHLAEAIDAEWGGALPHTVILAADGSVFWRHTGRVEGIELRRKILQLIDGE